ncbi:MAG TPA: hypothetical protein VG815_08210 [Chloroflexota bacterium]|nr:hypothetical protein [Chloroflexota bacterium]
MPTISNGDLSTVTPPNSTATTYSYNANDQLDKVVTTKSGSADFSFDASGTANITPSGNVQNVTTSQASALNLLPGASGSPGTDSYSCDTLSRLTNDAQTGTGSVTSTLGYADNGEIHQVTSGNTIDNGTYSYGGTSGNDPGPVRSVGSGLAFDYNGNGDRTCQGTAVPCSSHTTYTYTWDGADRLTGWTDTSGYHYVLTYDGNGLLQEALYRYPSGRTCPNIVRRHVVRREVSRHSTDCNLPAIEDIEKTIIEADRTVQGEVKPMSFGSQIGFALKSSGRIVQVVESGKWVEENGVWVIPSLDLSLR